MSGNGPVKKFDGFPVEVAVWAGDNGRFSVTVHKRYKDKDGTYKSTGFFSTAEAIVAGRLLDRAADWIMLQQRQPQSRTTAPHPHDAGNASMEREPWDEPVGEDEVKF